MNEVGLRTGDRVLASLLDWAALFTSCEGVLGLLTGLLTRPLIVIKVSCKQQQTARKVLRTEEFPNYGSDSL